MNDASIPTKTGKAWTPSSVRAVLTNPWYIGHYVYNVHSGGKGVEKSTFDRASDSPEYRPQLAISGNDNTITEADTLKSKRRRIENALARLNALYLYDDEAMPEKDFVMQRSDLSRQLDQINARLEELQANDAALPMGGKDLAMRGSYFLMLEDLVQDSYIDFERYIRSFDRAVQKSFLASSIDHIDADDGRVAAITFKNGITHRFTYKA